MSRTDNPRNHDAVEGLSEATQQADLTAGSTIGRHARVAAVARVERDQAQLCDVWREQLAQLVGRDVGRISAAVPGQRVRAAVLGAVAEDVQCRNWLARSLSLRERVAQLVDGHVGDCGERVAARPVERALLAGRWHVGTGGRPREEDARRGRGRTEHRRIGPGVTQEHVRQLAEVLAGGLDGQQFPWQQVQLRGGGPDDEFNRPSVRASLGDLDLHLRPRAAEQELPHLGADTLGQFAGALAGMALAQSGQVGQEALAPVESDCAVVATGPTKQILLRAQVHPVWVIAYPGADELQYQLHGGAESMAYVLGGSSHWHGHVKVVVARVEIWSRSMAAFIELGRFWPDQTSDIGVGAMGFCVSRLCCARAR